MFEIQQASATTWNRLCNILPTTNKWEVHGLLYSPTFLHITNSCLEEEYNQTNKVRPM